MEDMSELHSTVSVYLIAYDAPRVIDFIRDVFAGEVLLRHDREDGTVQHATLAIDESTIMIADGSEEMPHFPAWLHVYVDDVDATYQLALDHGAVSVREPQDEPDGDRRAAVRDSSGNVWWIGAPVA